MAVCNVIEPLKENVFSLGGKGKRFFGFRGTKLNVAVGFIAGMDFLYAFLLARDCRLGWLTLGTMVGFSE